MFVKSVQNKEETISGNIFLFLNIITFEDTKSNDGKDF